MISFFVFIFAAVLAAIGFRLVAASTAARGPRPEAVVFVGAVLGAAFLGLLFHAFSPRIGLSELGAAGVLPMVALLLVAAVLYALCALRGALGGPPFLADLLVIAAALASLHFLPDLNIHILRRPASSEYFDLGKWAAPLTIIWMWAAARMTAAMNRAPQVTGGYLGIVASVLWVLVALDARGATSFSATIFPTTVSAALAGAGLASLPFALRRANFNLSWSAALAMGFLLAQVATLGFLKNTAFAILALSLLAFGLPLLDVSFYRLKARRRDKKVDYQEEHLRLHEVLRRRGLAPAKIAALYLLLGAWLCALGVLLARWVPAPIVGWQIALRLAFWMIMTLGGALLFFSVTRVLMRRREDEEIPDEVEAFGVKISPVTMQEALDRIDEFVAGRAPRHVLTSDANSILRAQEDAEYAAIMQRADLITPDGYGLVWGARLLNLPIYERVTGVDMVSGICERLARHGGSIYILGSAPGVAATAAQKLSERFSGLRVAGTQHGYFQKDGLSEEEVARAVRDAKPDVLFVAFGIPRQEKFIAQHRDAMAVPVSLGVGGSFDVYSENLKRAPEYVQRSGMEWLYRVWQEPARWKRMSYVPRFMLFALRTWIFGAPKPKAQPHNPPNV